MAIVVRYISVINTFVKRKSIARTATEALTTAFVVARPTPCVPPLARSPTWHPMLTSVNPSTTGLMKPIQRSSTTRPATTLFQYTL